MLCWSMWIKNQTFVILFFFFFFLELAPVLGVCGMGCHGNVCDLESSSLLCPARQTVSWSLKCDIRRPEHLINLQEADRKTQQWEFVKSWSEAGRRKKSLCFLHKHQNVDLSALLFGPPPVLIINCIPNKSVIIWMFYGTKHVFWSNKKGIQIQNLFVG